MDISGIELLDDPHIGADGYRYLGILQLDRTLSTKMKCKVTAEYTGRVKRLCTFKLNSRNRIRGINVWAIGVERYSAGILDWTINGLVNMDRRIWKILAMHGCLHIRSNVDRRYLLRKEG